MFGILVSAFNSVLAWIVRSVIAKFVVIFAIYFIIQEFIGNLAPHIPGVSSINSAFASIPSGVWYFLDLFGFSAGVPLVMAAYISRFLIRRIPLIG